MYGDFGAGAFAAFVLFLLATIVVLIVWIAAGAMAAAWTAAGLIVATCLIGVGRAMSS
jgi:hypothetical protein